MPEPVSPALDFSAVTGDQEPVTLVRLDRDTGATAATVTGVAANRLRPGGRTEGTPDGGGVPVVRLTWHVRGDFLFPPGATPRQPAKGDLITDAAGVAWVVDAASDPKAGEPFVCETVRLPGA